MLHATIFITAIFYELHCFYIASTDLLVQLETNYIHSNVFVDFYALLKIIP